MIDEAQAGEPEVLSFKEAARFLRVSERTLRRLVSEKKVPYARIGGLLRFRRAALMSWLEQEEQRILASRDHESGLDARLPIATTGAGAATHSEETPEERRARVYALAGALAHLPNRVDDFLRRKQEEIDIEERKYERRHGENR